jgi:hypothetical protein
VARILIVGGGCKGRRLAAQMTERVHAVRATTRTEAGRAAIEATGAECWIGTPDRLATLRGALENVTIACWMLADAHGETDAVQALHGSRLEFFLSQAIDTTVRGLIYDATPGRVPQGALDEGERLARSLTALNAIPLAVLGTAAPARADGAVGDRAVASGDSVAAGGGTLEGDEAWAAEAAAAVERLLARA